MFSFIKSGVNSLVQNVTKFSSFNLSKNLSTLTTIKTNLLGSNNLLNNTKASLLSKEIVSSFQKPEFTQVRFNWGYKGRMMLKDMKRRELLRKFAPERVRLQTLRANSILPKVLRKSAEEQLQSMSRHSSLGFITNRCMITSKAGGCLHRWRLSRNVWRLMADYNQMSGVTRATWGVTSKKAVSFSFRKNRRDWFHYDGYRMVSYIDRDGLEKKQRFKLV